MKIRIEIGWAYFVVAAILAVFKFMGVFPYSWFWVFSPILIAFGIAVLLGIMGVGVRRGRDL